MKNIANNKKAYYNYFIEETLEAGIELQGWEVKSARASNVNLNDCFVFFDKGEAYLKNAHFSNYENGNVSAQNPTRDRKLLIKRSQIDKLYTAVKAKGATCIATKIYLNNKGLVKVEIALAKGKHNYDKKQTLKEKDLKREAERETAQRNRN